LGVPIVATKQSKEDVTPGKFPDVLPRGGHSTVNHDFTLQAVMHMKEAVGRLIEAVDTLKEQSKSNNQKLDEAVKDIHGAKVAGRALLWAVGVTGTLIAGALTFVGWAIKTYMSTAK